MTKDLNLLRLLVVLSEEKQTTTAARRLHVSQPTISVMLRKLRDQFNDPLFVRDKNKLEPTVRCQQILQGLPSILDSIDALYLDEETWDISQVSGEVTLIFSPPLMSTIAAPLVQLLSSKAPNATVDCYHWGFDALRDIELKNKCWGFSALPMDTNKNIMQKDIGNDEFVVVMRKDHPINGNSLNEVLDYPLCVNLVYGDSGSSRSEQIFRKMHRDKKVGVRTSDVMVMLHLVEQSDYLGIVSKHLLPKLDERFRYVDLPIELPEEAHYRPLALFSHQRNRHDPLTQWLHERASTLLS
ncbi:LysR family transcriptional regulator [Vibrio astriarenae]|uniref:LysR family transcriptional regulator n=1 Tax=Vibrio astriarenae TaxID=1481923 RepID=A0A7Z2YFD5_9VIBR|nr:LysR family transcriptional regulator [Vibrio astriarenae]QIA65074.1 LysR family transcriptional regulator [Vibrio astriarenae]